MEFPQMPLFARRSPAGGFCVFADAQHAASSGSGSGSNGTMRKVGLSSGSGFFG